MKNGESRHEEAKTSAEKIERMIEDVTAKGRALMGEGLDNAKEIWEDGTERLRLKAAEWGVDEMANDVRTYVRRNPWKSLGIAAGVGLLAGLILRSSPSRRD